ncbi:MAG: outer membrane beta-barrel protein [Ginsengibacter sp.]
MKKTALAFIAILFTFHTFAQDDSMVIRKQNDTIRIGGMIILKKGDTSHTKRVTVTVGNRRRQKPSNISTASFIVDLGFANWTDKTNYGNATADGYLVNRPGAAALGENDFKLKTIKSVNVNIWFFMQRLNLIKHYVNLKYGLGIELNNYRFKSAVSLNEGGNNPYTSQNIPHPFIFRDSISFSKNKLAADYVTVPFMLNFRTNPNSSSKGLSLSAGVSAGYLYSSRNKQISDERGKKKNRGDYDLEKWKFSYIAELGLGPAHLYGSYSPNSIFEKGLNLMPYNIGIRLSNW